MKKKRIIFYCITLMLFCQVVPVAAISEEQKSMIVGSCETIRDNLKNIQKTDARTRAFFGARYETILTKFITPLNVRMIENNLSDIKLIENQNNFATAKSTFAIDFVVYQQTLEELIAIDCKKEPERFYEKLVLVREKRENMIYDIAKLKTLTLKNIELVRRLRESL